MAKYLVLSGKPFDFEDQNGKRIQGLKISYVSKRSSVKEGEYGNPPLIATVSNMELAKKLNAYPAIYDMEFEQTAGKNNKPEIYLADVNFVTEVDISVLF